MDNKEFQELFAEITDIKKNPYHPLVWISGEPEFGEDVYIGGMSEVYAKGARVVIGDCCDIASFVVINCSDSHKKTIGIAEDVERKDIIIEDHVYIGTQSFIAGGVHIGHHSVVGAGTIVREGEYPPYSLIVGNPAIIKSGYYLEKAPETLKTKAFRNPGGGYKIVVIILALVNVTQTLAQRWWSNENSLFVQQ